ncbi:MAG: FAD-binding oxidoreductase [Deinococcales bacterium]
MSDKQILDCAVIGKGLIGSAALRYLSDQTAIYGSSYGSIAMFGPDEPKDIAHHQGVFASHYDEGRLLTLSGKGPLWSLLTEKSLASYERLQKGYHSEFYRAVGHVFVHQAAKGKPLPCEVAKERQLAYEFFEAQDKSWQEKFPDFSFPAETSFFYESAPSGLIRPRQLIEAQLAHSTAQIIRERVLAVEEKADRVMIYTTADSYSARQIIIAAGAFSNFIEGLPRQLPLKLKTEAVIFGEVAEAFKLPCLNYDINDPEISGIYLTPPLDYPDGKSYLKMGADTKSDLWPKTLKEIQDWFRQGDSDIHKQAFMDALRSIFPKMDFLSFHTGRCIITYTPSGYPTIDHLSDRIMLAAGGNGSSAKCSDALGHLAVQLLNKSWPEDIPRQPFRLQS